MLERFERYDKSFPIAIGRGYSMCLTFHVPPIAKEQGICDIDSLSLEKLGKRYKKVLIQK